MMNLQYAIWVHCAVVTIFLLLLIKNIVKNIFFTEHQIKRKFEMINKYGLYKYLFIGIPAKIGYILSLIYAYYFAEYSIIWLVLSIIYSFILLTSLFFIPDIKYNIVKEPKIESENLRRGIKSKRIYSIVDLVILSIWLYSWKSLIIKLLKTLAN